MQCETTRTLLWRENSFLAVHTGVIMVLKYFSNVLPHSLKKVKKTEVIRYAEMPFWLKYEYFISRDTIAWV